jgi:hypothetical protein
MAMRWRSTFSSNRSTCSSFQEKEGSRSSVLRGLLKATLVSLREWRISSTKPRVRIYKLTAPCL